MFCPQCGQRNPDQARFCAQCGSPLPTGAAQAPRVGGGAPASPSYGDAFAPPPPPSFDSVPASPPPPAGQAPAYGPPPPAQPSYPSPAYGSPPAPASAAWGPPPPATGPAPYAVDYGAAGYGAAPAMEYKGVMPRFFATLLDGILTSIALGLVSGLLGGGLDPEALASGELAYALSGTPALLVIALGWGYPIVFEGLFGGTIGKLILGMRVVNAEGENIGLGRALVRNLLRIIDMLPLLYILGAILVSSSDTKQRLGDRVAGTYVVAR
jgi:uncharacterized RDD family membrane protein YckC